MSSFSPSDKPVILQLSSSCVVEHLEVLCHCSVESNPKAVVIWRVNGTVPPHDYNISITSEPDRITVNLRGYMDKPQTVICFASNTLGNETLLLLQEGEGDFCTSKRMITKCCNKKTKKNDVVPLLKCFNVAAVSICSQ